MTAIFRICILGLWGLTLSCSSTQRVAEMAEGIPHKQVNIKSPRAHQVEVHGHRGARAHVPENTIGSFEFALEAGVDYLELDLQVTKDDVLIVGHDFILNSQICARRDGRPLGRVVVRHMTYEELREFECGSKANPDFPAQRPIENGAMPTLDEFFEWIKASKHPNAKRVHFNIETKMSERGGYSPSPSDFAKLLMETLKRHGMQERTVVQSFDFRTLMEVRILEPGIRIAALFGARSSRDDFIPIAEALKANIVSPHYRLLNAEVVKALQDMGVAVLPWTVNNPADWGKMLDMGVDGIITDDPTGLIDYLKRRAP